MASHPRALCVSPCIKAARWSFLFSGIFYGMKKKAHYQKIENREKPIRLRRIEEYEENERAYSKQTFKDLMIELAAIYGIDLPPDYEPPN